MRARFVSPSIYVDSPVFLDDAHRHEKRLPSQVFRRHARPAAGRLHCCRKLLCATKPSSFARDRYGDCAAASGVANRGRSIPLRLSATFWRPVWRARHWALDARRSILDGREFRSGADLHRAGPCSFHDRIVAPAERDRRQ